MVFFVQITKVKKGTTVGVSVSNGKAAQVEIPTVVGMGRDDAEAQLKALGLTVTVEEAHGSTTSMAPCAMTSAITCGSVVFSPMRFGLPVP